MACRSREAEGQVASAQEEGQGDRGVRRSVDAAEHRDESLALEHASGDSVSGSIPAGEGATDQALGYVTHTDERRATAG